MDGAADYTAVFEQVPFGRGIDAEDIAESLAFFDDWEDRYRYLIDLGKELPPGHPIGESWEIFWKNRVANGEYEGKTLGDVIKMYPLEIAGKANAGEEFPLLVKFLDAQEWLSVQVHPDDVLAGKLEGDLRIARLPSRFRWRHGLRLPELVDLDHPGRDRAARALPNQTSGKPAREHQRAEKG